MFRLARSLHTVNNKECICRARCSRVSVRHVFVRVCMRAGGHMGAATYVLPKRSIITYILLSKRTGKLRARLELSESA